MSSQGRKPALNDDQKDDIANAVQNNPDESIAGLHKQDDKGVSYSTYNKAVHETGARAEEDIQARQVGQSGGSAS